MMSLYSASETQLRLAEAAKKRRKFLDHSRERASEVSGIPESTIRKFESTGEISFRQFLTLMQVYSDLDMLKNVFENPPARTMDELPAIIKKQEKLQAD